MRTPTFMIVPSLACQAACKYCFGPHRGAVMDEDTARLAAAYVEKITQACDTEHIDVILHGGEPLMAPIAVLETLLAALADAAIHCGAKLTVSMQSNLWNMTAAHAALLARYQVQVGTSLDGPREWNDLNRGEGYFDRTAAGIRIAETAGLRVNVISTVTSATLPHAREILSYFAAQEYSMVLHGALDGMDGCTPLSLTPAQYEQLITGLLPWYASRRRTMRVDTLDHFIKNALAGGPHVCTLQNCYGMFLCISPAGDLTSCQRLAGRQEYTLGNICDMPSLEALRESPAAKRQLAREARVNELAKADASIARCAGGCYYNAVASGDGTLDPLCGAYGAIDAFIRAAAEAEKAAGTAAYAELAGDTHPMEAAANARGVLALYALGKYGDAEKAAAWLHAEKICGDPALTARILGEALSSARNDGIKRKRNNMYVHVTLNCNLRCTHCYADAGEGADMPLAAFKRLADETLEAGYRQLVVTGGEPLTHGAWREIAEICRVRRGRGVRTVLRTNLAPPLTDGDMRLLHTSFDQVFVSVDGTEAAHDARRGQGSYRMVCENLLRYAMLCGVERLTITSVMSAEDASGAEGDSVRALADLLGVRRIRFKPLLPIGRAAGAANAVCEASDAFVSPAEAAVSRRALRLTCGIGQNLFVLPDGRAYPCYAWRHDANYLGNVLDAGLPAILGSAAFRRLCASTVETNARCRTCEWRYLCGGACRAWGNRLTADVDVAPPDCANLRLRAEAIVTEARRVLLG